MANPIFYEKYGTEISREKGHVFPRRSIMMPKYSFLIKDNTLILQSMSENVTLLVGILRNLLKIVVIYCFVSSAIFVSGW